MVTQLLKRISVRWLPDQQYEDTETIALNVGGYFVDLRVNKGDSTVQWSRAGERIVLKEDPLTCRWTHIIDSLDLTEPDEAYFNKLPNGDDLEIGTTKCPFKDGAMTPYEEVWRDVTPSLESGDPSWIIQSSDGLTFVGKIGDVSVAIRKGSDGGFAVQKQQFSKSQPGWETSYTSEDFHELPRVSEILHEFTAGGWKWVIGQALRVGSVEYIPLMRLQPAALEDQSTKWPTCCHVNPNRKEFGSNFIPAVSTLLFQHNVLDREIPLGACRRRPQSDRRHAQQHQGETAPHHRSMRQVLQVETKEERQDVFAALRLGQIVLQSTVQSLLSFREEQRFAELERMGGRGSRGPVQLRAEEQTRSHAHRKDIIKIASISIGNRSTPSLLRGHHGLHYQAKLFYPSERPPLKIPVRGIYYEKRQATAGHGYAAHFSHFNALQIPRDVARRLFDNYTENILPRYPCFASLDLEELFNQTYHEDLENGERPDVPMFFITMILAVSSLTSKRHDFRKVAALSESLHLDAMRRVTFLSDATLRSLQGLLLLMQLALLLPDTGNLWYMTGEAMRMAIGLGLHQEPDQALTADPAHAELRRCLFWVTYQLGRTVAIASGCPIALGDEHITTRLPYDGGNPHASLGESPFNENRPSRESQFLIHTRVCILQSEMHSVQYFDRPIPEWLPDYDTWVQRTTESIDIVQQFYNNRVAPAWLIFAVHQCKILLHRPCSRNIAPSSSSLIEVVAASIQLIATSFNLATAGGVVHAWELANSAFHAGMVLLYALRNHNTEIKEALLGDDSHNALSVLVQLFDALSHRWPAIRDTGLYITELVETNLRNPVGNYGSEYDMNVLEELDFLVTQRRIHSIYHRNIPLPNQSSTSPQSVVLSQQGDLGLLEDDTWWRDFINEDFAMEVVETPMVTVEAISMPMNTERSPPGPTYARTVPCSKNWKTYLDGVLEALPSCSFCRDRRIKCNRQIPSCKECSRTSRACSYFDPVLLENVPFQLVLPLKYRDAWRIYTLAEKVRALAEQSSSSEFASETFQHAQQHSELPFPMQSILIPLQATDDRHSAQNSETFVPSSSMSFFGACSILGSLDSFLQLNPSWGIQRDLKTVRSQHDRVDLSTMVPCLGFPPFSAAAGLVSLFQKSANTFFPVIASLSMEETLSHAYENDTSALLGQQSELFYLALAIASQVGKREDPLLAMCANAYFYKALSQSSTSCEHYSRASNLFLLQRTLLIAVFLLLNPASGDIWRTLGFAIRLFFDLSHRPSMDEDKGHHLFCLLTRTLYCLESQVSVAFGRPTLLVIGDKLRDELITPSSGDLKEHISIYYYLISFKKMQFHSRVLQNTSGAPDLTCQSASAEVDCQEYRRGLDEWLVNWRTGLEEHPVNETDDGSNRDELLAWGELQYYHALFLLSRIWPTPGGHPTYVCSNISRYSTDLARHQHQSAYLSSDKEEEQTRFIYPMNWTVSHLIFQAGTSVLSEHKLDLGQQAQEAEAMQKCLVALSLVEADPDNLSTSLGLVLEQMYKMKLGSDSYCRRKSASFGSQRLLVTVLD
ncbi:hypothetical protein G7046_g379 [Stylonectria norvegica]|nr:hypothetical protein G7046_g379 [Stylonectria norvegica]